MANRFTMSNELFNKISHLHGNHIADVARTVQLLLDEGYLKIPMSEDQMAELQGRSIPPANDKFAATRQRIENFTISV